MTVKPPTKKLTGWDAIIRDVEYSLKVFPWMVTAAIAPVGAWLILGLTGAVGGAELGWFLLASLAAFIVGTTLLIVGPKETRPETELASHRKEES